MKQRTDRVRAGLPELVDDASKPAADELRLARFLDRVARFFERLVRGK